MNYASEALEQQIASLFALEKCYARPALRPGVSPKEREQWRTDMHALRRAQPFYWNDRCRDLIVQAMQDFKLDEIEASRHLVYCDVGWCWFGGKPLFEIESYETKQPIPVQAVSWYCFGGRENHPYLGITAYGRQQQVQGTGEWVGPVLPLIWTCVHLGDKMSNNITDPELNFVGYTDERTEQEIVQLKLFVAAASTFLRQKLLTLQPASLERHARKRVEKQGVHGTLPAAVQVVQLRRTEPRQLGVQEDVNGEAQIVDWNWQWTVKGHVRQQFYATLNEHLPVWIHPYVKGPEDKPLKPRATPIYSVTR